MLRYYLRREMKKKDNRDSLTRQEHGHMKRLREYILQEYYRSHFLMHHRDRSFHRLRRLKSLLKVEHLMIRDLYLNTTLEEIDLHQHSLKGIPIFLKNPVYQIKNN